MTKIFVILFLFLAISCHHEANYDVANYKFDNKVIEKLPLYDSLVKLIIADFPSIKQHIKDNMSFEWEPYWDSVILYEKFPRESALKIDKTYHQMGDNFIYAFSVYRDSSVRISVREFYDKKEQAVIREYLSYSPNGASKKERDYRFKDTILNKNWLYWVMFDDD